MNNDNTHLLKTISNVTQSKIVRKETESSINDSNLIFCRVCFRKESDVKDPLISPCKCSGTMSFIHVNCLKSCIKSKMTSKHFIDEEKFTEAICYYWNSLNCDICLEEYPKYINYKLTTYNLVDNMTTYHEYAQFEIKIFDDTKQSLISKGVLFLKLIDNREYTIGRTNLNLIKLKDISVSRNHCSIYYKNEKLFISGNKTKFGTLVYSNIGEELSYNNQLVNLLSGKVHFQVIMFVSWSFSNLFFCCKSSIKEDEFLFNNDNDKIQFKKENKNNIETQKIKSKIKEDSLYDLVLFLDEIPYYKDNSEKELQSSFI